MNKYNLKKTLVSILICIMLYYFFLWNFIAIYISRETSTQMILFTVCTYFIYILITIIFDRELGKNERTGFILLYLVLLATLFYSKTVYVDSTTNILNFDIRNLKYSTSTNIGLLVVVMNFVLLIPLGFIFRKFDIVFKIIFPIILTTLIEYTQYRFNVGVFDINDIILNTLGFYVGAIIVPKYWNN